MENVEFRIWIENTYRIWMEIVIFVGGSDSESEFSSLERKKDNIYTKVQRKPTPHKKKHKHKSTDETPPHHHTDRLHVHVDHLEKGKCCLATSSNPTILCWPPQQEVNILNFFSIS